MGVGGWGGGRGVGVGGRGVGRRRGFWISGEVCSIHRNFSPTIYAP